MDTMASNEKAGFGVGPVDALFNVIADMVSRQPELEQYAINAITGGTDAQGEVTVSARGRNQRCGTWHAPRYFCGQRPCLLRQRAEPSVQKGAGRPAPSLPALLAAACSGVTGLAASLVGAAGL